jgi:hypothetical protein
MDDEMENPKPQHKKCANIHLNLNLILTLTLTLILTLALNVNPYLTLTLTHLHPHSLSLSLTPNLTLILTQGWSQHRLLHNGRWNGHPKIVAVHFQEYWCKMGYKIIVNVRLIVYKIIQKQIHFSRRMNNETRHLPASPPPPRTSYL